MDEELTISAIVEDVFVVVEVVLESDVAEDLTSFLVNNVFDTVSLIQNSHHFVSNILEQIIINEVFPDWLHCSLVQVIRIETLMVELN